MASKIVAVRKAVVDGIAGALLESDPANKKISVSYGWVGGDEKARREQIYTNRPRATHDPHALRPGKRIRVETMEFDVVVLVFDPKRNPEEVDDRVMEIGEVVEDYLAENYDSESLDVPGLNWLLVRGFEMENRATPTGALTLAQYTVQYVARLE